MSNDVTHPPTRPDGRRRARVRSRRRSLWWAVAAVCLIAPVAVLTAVFLAGAKSAPPRAAAPSVTVSGTPVPGVPAVSAAQLAKLPVARYDAVIGGLLPFTGDATTLSGAFRLTADAPLFGADRYTPVARLAAKDFVGAPTTVVVVGRSGPWSMVLTPARVALPSASGGNAPAQSAAWIATAALRSVGTLPDRIEISVGKQTLTILHDGAPAASFAVGVGTAGTPTPTNVTGYLQQRYLDPRQDETVYPIQLTSLHATTKDEPYGGNDGGLIGIHFNPVNAGAVSHGCVRLTADAITAVNQLPLGTPVTIVD
jgi:lipoprotein-anchoring transpeptidase ErfK/SrfK